MPIKRRKFTIPFIARDLHGDYVNVTDCPVARAAKRYFNWQHRVRVGPNTIDLDNRTFDTLRISRVSLNGRRIYGHGLGGFDTQHIAQLQAAFVRNPKAKAQLTVQLYRP